MTDEQFIEALQQRSQHGDKSGMWAILKGEGQMARLITLAARGVAGKVSTKKRSPAQDAKTKITAPPDEAQKASAVKYWNEHRRPDLVARIDQVAESFFNHHYARGTRMVSWPAAWRTWYCNQLEYSPVRNGGPSAVVSFEQTDAAGWLERLKVFHGLRDQMRGTWNGVWGPKPGDTGCRVPESVMAEFAAKWGRRSA